jgi:hypothetical protein
MLFILKKAVFVSFVAFRLSINHKVCGRTNRICPTIDFCSVHVTLASDVASVSRKAIVKQQSLRKEPKKVYTS